MSVFDPIYFTGTEWFVRDGDIYVSSIGDDITGNGEPLNPYASISKAISVASEGDKIIVGNGRYDEVINGAGKSILLIADREAIMSKALSPDTAFSNLGTATSITGFRIEGYQKSIEGTIDTLEDCIFINTSIENFGGTIKGCILKGVVLNASGDTNLFSNTFIQVTFGNAASGKNRFIDIYDCHFSNDSVAEFDSAITENFDFCNQQSPSQIKVDGVVYTTAAALHTSFSQFQSKGISVAPGFNSPNVNDFSLSEGSLLKNAGRYNRQIGARTTGLHRNRQGLMPGVKLENITVDSSGRYTLTDGFEEGHITTPSINLGKIRVLGTIRLFAEQSYEFPPENAVVDYQSVNRAPNAISFRMRFANSPSRLATMGYKEFIWNRIPTVDAAGRGNADEDFEFNDQRFISAQYVQLIITLRKSEETFYLVQENTDCLLQEEDSNIIWKY